MLFYHKLAMGTEEYIVSVKLQPNMTQNAQDLKICSDYWAYENKTDFIGHVEAICQRYNISPHIMFVTVGQCFTYLDDVLCEYCGYVCPLEVPADIPFMRAKESWCCEVCEHALWREHNSK